MKKINKAIKLILLIILTLNCVIVRSQIESEPGLDTRKNFVPHSPEAESLLKYEEIPVDEFTGVPSINIPISSVSSGDVSLPVNLSYHASGLKVNEIANRVGAGWSLSTGGVISRTIMGNDDRFVHVSCDNSVGNNAFMDVFDPATGGEPSGEANNIFEGGWNCYWLISG